MTNDLYHQSLFPSFPRPLDGKTILYSIVSEFASEFNEQAIAFLRNKFDTQRTEQWHSLKVTSAYPTIAQHCPRIAIIRRGSTPRIAGLGASISHAEVQTPQGDIQIQTIDGQQVTDQIEVAICCLNEWMRDDLFVWLQQYILDAAIWMAKQWARSSGFADLRCTGGEDDNVEYQGAAAQPGFQFFIGRLNYTVTYDQIIVSDFRPLLALLNWQQWGTDLLWAGAAGDYELADSILNPPDEFDYSTIIVLL